MFSMATMGGIQSDYVQTGRKHFSKDSVVGAGGAYSGYYLGFGHSFKFLFI